MKILTIVGARPQFIKAAAVSRKLTGHKNISETILHTGQHYDSTMSEVFFTEMEIPEPKYNLGVQSSFHGAMTGEMITGIEKTILEDKPDAIMVYGDTNSTLAGAIAAVKLHVPIIHVEAGLRSFNLSMPEEINRILTDRISSLLCCPTEGAMNNLKKEGFANFPSVCLNTGDVMQDAANFYSEKSASRSTVIAKHSLSDFILCTFHRAENTNDPVKLGNIINALNEIHKQCPVVLPVHPRTRKTLSALQLKTDFMVIDPVGYFDMLELLKHCRLVITDSGGLQKEAYFFSKFCVTIREETEWTDLIENGFNVLAGSDQNRIIDSVETMLNKKADFSLQLFGAGKAAEHIIAAIEKHI